MASATERAKDKIDAGARKAKKAGHELADKVKQGARNLGQKMKNAGQKLKNKA